MPTSYNVQTSIFADEQVLTEEYTPEGLPERESELETLHMALMPAARGVGANNVFLYGKAGQGKTAAAEVELEELEYHAEHESEILDLTTLMISCEGLTSSYQVASRIVQELTDDRPIGRSTDVVFSMMYDAFDVIGGTIILVLDEIDNIGTDDRILYSIPRARAKDYVADDVYPSVIGISNNLQWRDNLSPKVKDSLYDDSIHFAPYDATQLQSILERRTEKAFVEGAVSDDPVSLAAAFSAQDKGSARQAIQYLYKAGQLASNRGDDTLTGDHLREAEEQVERKRIVEGIESLTIQGTLALAAITKLELSDYGSIRTKHAYTAYRKLAELIDAEPLVRRRMRDHLLDLDMQGILTAKKQGAGSVGGQYYTFELIVAVTTVVDILRDISRFNTIEFLQ